VEEAVGVAGVAVVAAAEVAVEAVGVAEVAVEAVEVVAVAVEPRSVEPAAEAGARELAEAHRRAEAVGVGPAESLYPVGCTPTDRRT
jgi:hypothetical protein